MEYNRVSIPLRRLDSGCQVMVIMIHLKKESIPYFYFWLTVIEWLGIDFTGTVSVNAPLFGHIYIPWVNSQY